MPVNSAIGPRHRARGRHLLLFGAVLVLGSEGVFTEDWMGHPGPMDPTGATYQAGAVRFLLGFEAVTVGLALAFRLWTTVGAQLVLLSTGALFIGSLRR